MRQSSQNDLSYDSSIDTSGFHSRRSFIRGETDRILSYYENHASAGNLDSEPENDRGYPRRMSSESSATSSSSEYSSENIPPSSAVEAHHRGKGKREAVTFGRSERCTTRTSGPSEGGPDRRHIAVVEMDSKTPPIGHKVSSGEPSSARTRRGLSKPMSGVTLVTPSNALPSAYTNLPPPSSAPANIATTPDHAWHSHHQRSASEAVAGAIGLLYRDVGIVRADNRQYQHNHSYSNHTRLDFEPEGLNAPIFQAQSKSPLGISIPEYSSTSSFTSSMTSGPVTPEIRYEKGMRQPVVRPVVVGASGAWSALGNPSLTTFSPSVPSSYLHYQPGIDSIAGPPPPPIQRLLSASSSIPPPRPPRMSPTVSVSSRTSDLVATKESLTLPSHVSATLASRLSSSSLYSPNVQTSEPQLAGITSEEAAETGKILDSPVTLRPSRSMHIREGAFPPSTSGPMSPPISPQPSTLDGSIISITPSQEIKPSLITSDEPNLSKGVEVESSTSELSNDKRDLSTRPGLDIRREASCVNLKAAVDAEPESDRTDASLPSPTKESTNPLNATLTDKKRFSSLPRTPSLTSMSLHTGWVKASRTPSPSLPPIPVRRKVISIWPAAMQFNDIVVHRSSLDRSIGYANKINELAAYDCGLGEWVIATKHRGNSRQQTSRPTSLNPTYQAPSSLTNKRLLRQLSHGSMVSEATFPTRADAYTATDLSPRSEDDIPTATPLLPYPSLAQDPRSAARNSVVLSPPSTVLSLPIPLAGSKSGGFFFSLGRKTTTRADRMIGNPSSPGKVLSKRQPPNLNPRPVQLANAPVVPGGPRAPPGRSQSIKVSRLPSVEDLTKSPQRKRSSMVRRTSLFSPLRGSDPTPASDSRASAEFNDQLEKLIVLLPHADRDTLAGYLRRSGQDILAVGRYLEDEKNGTIIRS